MGSLFNPDSPLMSGLSKLFDIVVLNIVFVLCCMPLFTIGASLSALYTVTMKMARGEDPYVFQTFFVAFKRNFKPATITWILMVILGLTLYVDLEIIAFLPEILASIFRVLTFALVFLYTLTMVFIFPYIARFENTIFKGIKNAFLIASFNLHYAIPILILLFGSVFATFFTVQTMTIGMAVWMLGGGVVLALVQSFFFVHVFKKYE